MYHLNLIQQSSLLLQCLVDGCHVRRDLKQGVLVSNVVCAYKLTLTQGANLWRAFLLNGHIGRLVSCTVSVSCLRLLAPAQNKQNAQFQQNHILTASWTAIAYQILKAKSQRLIDSYICKCAVNCFCLTVIGWFILYSFSKYWRIQDVSLLIKSSHTSCLYHFSGLKFDTIVDIRYHSIKNYHVLIASCYKENS